MQEIPRYRCHKEVRAIKIAEIRRDEMPKFTRPTCRGSFSLGSGCGHCERCEWERYGREIGATIIPAESGFCSLRVDSGYLHKHKPEAGGYYVVYEDGYRSFSPAKAFEEGYSRVD